MFVLGCAALYFGAFLFTWQPWVILAAIAAYGVGRSRSGNSA